MHQLNTIRGTVNRAQSEGIGVTECAVRRWVRDGELPYVRSGYRVYITWHQFLVFLGAEKQNTG